MLIDGYNALFHSKSKVRLEQGEFIPSERIAPLKPFFDLTTADWHNGAAVLVCDEVAVPGHNESRFPLYQLTLKVNICIRCIQLFSETPWNYILFPRIIISPNINNFQMQYVNC